MRAGSLATPERDARLKPDEFIREVDEELQREQLLRLWRRIGPWLIAAAALVVLGTAGKVGYDSWRDSRLQARAAAFADAERRAGSSAQAAEIWLGVAANERDGLAVLATLRAAAALREAGDRGRAIELLDRLGRENADPLFADLARLVSARSRLDSADTAALAAELEPLAAAGRPFRHSARETLGLSALRTGDRERARALLRELVDDATAPSGLKTRARELLDALGAGGEEVAS
ncbi:hypothetical protein HRbin40_02002 [bacterium HR40]|nr:hypothetical protein HRbin40_02002 [bacterium HR40]